MLHTRVRNIIAEVLIDARVYGNTKETFGAGYAVRIPRITCDIKCLLSALHRLVEQDM